MPETPDMTESISVRDFYESFKDELKLTLLAGEKGLDTVIREKSVNRPALALTGYFKHFANKRMQLFGAGEMAYLKDLPFPEQKKIVREIMNKRIPVVIVTRKITPPSFFLQAADEANVPVLSSPLKTKDFIAQSTLLLENKFAPHTALHGTLLDVRGVGVFLRGKSGVGKSECALALVGRGHSLVADDHTYIHRVGERELMGSSSELARGYMECRGIGLINVAELFGVNSVRREKRIDMVVTFLEWGKGVEEERTGLDMNYFDILDIPVPHMEIPVRPGRDMARLVEVAALVQSVRQLGHDPAREFNDKLIRHMQENKSPGK